MCGYEPVADLARENHAEHARRVRLERQQLQIEHELRVLVERRGDAGRAIGQRDGVLVACLGALNALLDLAHRVQIFAELRADRLGRRPRPGDSPPRAPNPRCCSSFSCARAARRCCRRHRTAARTRRADGSRSGSASSRCATTPCSRRSSHRRRTRSALPYRRRARASAPASSLPSTSAASWSALVASFTSTPGRVRSQACTPVSHAADERG